MTRSASGKPSGGPAASKHSAGAAGGAENRAPPLSPGLYLVATPIGNLRDITLRALDTLRAADIVACEDTRVTGKLLQHYGIGARTVAYHEHNAARARPMLLARLAGGASVALVSDAGTPLVSDPGYKLVREAIDAGIRVEAVPGPSAALAALSVAGLPTDRFLFAGFPPAKSAARQAFFGELARVPATLVFYESGPRLAASLADMAAVLGDRPAAVARELTKRFEETVRGSLRTLAEAYAAASAPKGEIVVLTGPPESGPDSDATEVDIDAMLRAALEGQSLKDAAAMVAAATGRPKREIYQRALALGSGEAD